MKCTQVQNVISSWDTSTHEVGHELFSVSGLRFAQLGLLVEGTTLFRIKVCAAVSGIPVNTKTYR